MVGILLETIVPIRVLSDPVELILERCLLSLKILAIFLFLEVVELGICDYVLGI